MRRGPQALTGASVRVSGAAGAWAATGLLTLAVRQTPLFGPVLTVHLAAIAVAFTVAPYTKFTHWLYRLLAIYKNTR